MLLRSMLEPKSTMAGRDMTSWSMMERSSDVRDSLPRGRSDRGFCVDGSRTAEMAADAAATAAAVEGAVSAHDFAVEGVSSQDEAEGAVSAQDEVEGAVSAHDGAGDGRESWFCCSGGDPCSRRTRWLWWEW